MNVQLNFVVPLLFVDKSAINYNKDIDDKAFMAKLINYSRRGKR